MSKDIFPFSAETHTVTKEIRLPAIGSKQTTKWSVLHDIFLKVALCQECGNLTQEIKDKKNISEKQK